LFQISTLITGALARMLQCSASDYHRTSAESATAGAAVANSSGVPAIENEELQ
jgi:hypothetical protein